MSAQSFAVSKAMTVDGAISFFLLTCLPELLPPAGYADLRDCLGSSSTNSLGLSARSPSWCNQLL